MDVLISTPVRLYPLSLLRVHSISYRPLEFTQDRDSLIPSLSKDEKCLPGSKEASFDKPVLSKVEGLGTNGLLGRVNESHRLNHKQLVLHTRSLLNGGLIDDD